MQNKLLDNIDRRQMRRDIPDFQSGDNVKVHVRIREGNKERIQIFEGLVIARKGSKSNATFKVRKISYGIGVERTFFVNSPLISQIEIMRMNKVRRAKLFYMRERQGKSARMKERKSARAMKKTQEIRRTNATKKAK